MRTIYIIWLRQIKRFTRSKSRILGSLGQPVLFLVAFGFGFGPMYEQASGGDYIQFLAPGIIAMSVIFTGMFNGADLIWDKRFGFLKETLVAPVSRISIMLGRTLGGATVAFIQGVIVLLLTALFGFWPASFALLPLALLFMFLLAIFFTAIGTAIASVLEDMQGFQLVINFLIMPTYFLSNALFPLENFPTAIKTVAILNPLSYGVDGMRGAMTNISSFSWSLDLLVVGIVTLALIIIGSFLFSRMQV